MDKREAIKILEHERDADIFVSDYRNRVHEALDFVIEELREPTVSEDCTEFLAWLVEVVLDDEDWELNAIAYGEVIARKLKKLGLLEVKDGYYVRANITPTERTGEWIEHKYAEEYDGLMQSNFECSKCHDWLREQTNYCPNCGAKMKGGTENE